MGVPHLRSLVMHLPFRPSFSRADVNYMELAVHLPLSEAPSYHFSWMGWIFGKSMKMCLDWRISGAVPDTLDLGFSNSVAFKSFPH